MSDDAPVCHLFDVSLADAVKQTADALDIAHGVAAARVVEAAHAGLIDGYWRGEFTNRLYRYRGAGKLMLRSEWASADIDWRADVVVLASGERRALVVLDRPHFEAWLSAQITEASPEGDQAEASDEQTETPPSDGPPPPDEAAAPTIADETRATAHLKTILEGYRDQGTEMSKGEAWKACEPFKLSEAGFRYRVWPNARQAAGLPRRASSGRKRRRPAEIERAVEQIIGRAKKSGN